jgi:hypothetical protein
LDAAVDGFRFDEDDTPPTEHRQFTPNYVKRAKMGVTHSDPRAAAPPRRLVRWRAKQAAARSRAHAAAARVRGRTTARWALALGLVALVAISSAFGFVGIGAASILSVFSLRSSPAALPVDPPPIAVDLEEGTATEEDAVGSSEEEEAKEGGEDLVAEAQPRPRPGAPAAAPPPPIPVSTTPPPPVWDPVPGSAAPSPPSTDPAAPATETPPPLDKSQKKKLKRARRASN